MTRYFGAEQLDVDDFGVPFTHEEGEAVYDARVSGESSWATMQQTTFDVYGAGLGTGIGQKYVRNADGHLIKVEGLNDGT